MLPLVSLVIAHHNRQATLPRLLDGILAQSLKELEVILVDDHSDASCEPLVSAYRNKGLEIRLLAHNERIHSMKARFAGVRAARSGIIAFVDPGDALWGTEALEKNVRLFVEKNADIVHFRTALIDAAGMFQSYASCADAFALSLGGEDIFAAYITSPEFWVQSGLGNKLLSRDVCETISGHAEYSVISGHAEHFYLMILAMFHARSYIGSQEVGYAHCPPELQSREIAASAVTMYHTANEIPAYLERHGCPKALITSCTRALHNIFCVFAGKLTLAIEAENGFIPDAGMEALLEQVDEDTLLRVLLLGNFLNVQKILGCLESIFPPVVERRS